MVLGVTSEPFLNILKSCLRLVLTQKQNHDRVCSMFGIQGVSIQWPSFKHQRTNVYLKCQGWDLAMILSKHHKRLNKNKIKAESNKNPKHKPVKTRHVPATPVFLSNPPIAFKKWSGEASNDTFEGRRQRQRWYFGGGLRGDGFWKCARAPLKHKKRDDMKRYFSLSHLAKSWGMRGIQREENGLRREGGQLHLDCNPSNVFHDMATMGL